MFTTTSHSPHAYKNALGRLLAAWPFDSANSRRRRTEPARTTGRNPRTIERNGARALWSLERSNSVHDLRGAQAVASGAATESARRRGERGGGEEARAFPCASAVHAGADAVDSRIRNTSSCRGQQNWYRSGSLTLTRSFVRGYKFVPRRLPPPHR